MVSALAARIRYREFESRDKHFPQNQFFLFPCLSFFSLNFEVKRCANIYWKYDNTGFAMEKLLNFYLFLKIANAQTTHCVIIKLSIKCTMPLHLMTNTIIRGKKERIQFVVLSTFWKNNNTSCFWYTNSFNWKSSFVLIYYKSEDGYPDFLFSYLLLIALYTNSTYIIWLKKYSAVFYFLNF